jgi:hypothetical protein
MLQYLLQPGKKASVNSGRVSSHSSKEVDEFIDLPEYFLCSPENLEEHIATVVCVSSSSYFPNLLSEIDVDNN